MDRRYIELPRKFPLLHTYLSTSAHTSHVFVYTWREDALCLCVYVCVGAGRRIGALLVV